VNRKEAIKVKTIKIKEMARKLQTTPRAIRFYEEQGLIDPQKDNENQYRTFSENDAWRLQTIISLREMNMSIKEIKKILEGIDEGEEQEVLHYLELQRSMMYAQWVELKQMIQTTDQMMNSFKRNQSLVWEDVFKLAKGTKKIRDLRSNWRDRWNFDRQASTYDEQVKMITSFNVHEDYEEALNLTFEWISPKEGEKGLDIGIGTGNLANCFLAKGIGMAGIDQSREMLKQCQLKHPQIETKLGNFLSIPYLDRQFDFIVTSYALHHLTDDQKLLALDEMRRVLKPHGRICITDLMFESQSKRNEYYQALQNAGKQEIIAQIEDEYFADRAKLIQWLEEHDYVTKQKQINQILHIVLAVPLR
jgi:putative AdoMet-dependent methyltransferase